MEKILKEILAELKYHTKLLENTFHKSDKQMHDAKKNVADSVKMFHETIDGIPGLKDNPQLKTLINNMTNMFPGG